MLVAYALVPLPEINVIVTPLVPFGVPVSAFAPEFLSVKFARTVSSPATFALPARPRYAFCETASAALVSLAATSMTLIVTVAVTIFASAIAFPFT